MVEFRNRSKHGVTMALLGLAACAPTAVVAQSAPFAPHDPAALHERSASEPWFDAGGVLRLDALATSTEVPDDSPGRDFYVPAATPLDDESGGNAFDAHGKFTTLRAAGGRPFGDGHRFSTYVEADLFQGDPEEATEGEADYGLSIRHAYVAFDDWLAGKTWSNFMDIGSMPDSVDPIGAADGAAFLRHGQVRWTRGPLSIALEEAETEINPTGGGPCFEGPDAGWPDVTARYTRTTDWGHWSVAALVRQFEYEAPAFTDDVIAFAGAFNGSYAPSASDSFRFGAYAGQGFGRYVGLGAAVDAHIELDDELEELEGVAGYASWQHVFDPRWRTNVTYARAEWDNDIVISGGAVVGHTQSFAANVIYAPMAALELGLEARVAEREAESGESGSLERLHLVVRYAF